MLQSRSLCSVQGRNSLVAKEGQDRFIHRLILPSLQGTQCLQVVHLAHNQTIHCPEDGVDVREPNPASTECQRLSGRLQLCKANAKRSHGQQQEQQVAACRPAGYCLLRSQTLKKSRGQDGSLPPARHVGLRDGETRKQIE